MEITITGIMRESIAHLPQEQLNELKYIHVHVNDPKQVESLQNIFNNYKKDKQNYYIPIKNTPHGINLKLIVRDVSNCCTSTMLSNYKNWDNRPLRIVFKPRGYRFLNKTGYAIVGVSATLLSIAFDE